MQSCVSLLLTSYYTQQQCLGCKALFASEKNCKLHVIYQFRFSCCGSSAGQSGRGNCRSDSYVAYSYTAYANAPWRFTGSGPTPHHWH
jgi:hypothetical protein